MIMTSVRAKRHSKKKARELGLTRVVSGGRVLPAWRTALPKEQKLSESRFRRNVVHVNKQPVRVHGMAGGHMDSAEVVFW